MSFPLTVTWPGGIGNPAGEKIVTSGGKRRRSTRRNRKNRKQTRKNRSCRRNRAGCTRRNRRS
jgi:hypothetical protein